MNENTPSRFFVRASLTGLIAVGLVAFAPPPASMPFALSTDFFQAANLGPPVGEIDWIGSILQQNNSIYAEGMSVPQRLVFLEIDPTAGNVHTLTFSHQATKGGDVHAYDFLTSWAQAIEAGKGHGPNDEDLLDELADPNVIVLSASGQAATDAEMESLWFPANSPEIGLGDITPDAMPNVGGGTGDVAAQISAYEANPLYGNRQVTVRAPDGFPVTNVSCDFTGYSPSGADFFAEYSLTWTSESPTIGIEFAGHLGVGISDGVVPGYGTGFGASNVSGGPYHFKLGLLDTKSLGSIDNQIKGADIIIDPPGCDLSGPTPVCEDATGLVYTNGVFDPAITYAWTFVSNTSGASFTSATNTNTVTVDAGGTSGGFTLQLSKTNAGGTTLCQFPVIVNPTTVVDDIADQSVCPDDPVSFTAVASGTGTLTYAWTKDGAPIGGNTATLDLGAVDEADEGEYCVTVTGDCGSDSDCATLTVRAPTVVDAIADQSVCPGTGVSFTASATGDGTLTYAWTKDGAPIGGNTATLDLGPVDESDEGEYCVTVTGGCGADSDCAILTVKAPTVLDAIADQSVCPGTGVSFTASATGDGALTYAWTKDGAPIGGNTATLDLGPVDESDEGEYCVTVTGGCGTDSDCAMLTVKPATVLNAIPDQGACPGATVSFTASATGDGTLTYAWTKDGAPIGGNTAVLDLGVVDETDEGEYCVTVTGGCGTDSDCATLTVDASTVLQDIPDQSVCPGTAVSFTASATGSGSLTYAWTKDGAPIGGNTATLDLGLVDETDEAEYCVTVTSDCGSDSDCATLTIKAPTELQVIADQSVCPGASVSFTASATGEGTLTYAWTKDGAPIGGNTATLDLGVVDEDDEGEYCVTVTGECGPDSDCATLTVKEPTVVQELPDQSACPGEEVRFTASATGEGTLTYAWTKDGVPIGGNTAGLDLGIVDESDEGEYCVTVTGECGSDSDCATLTINAPTVVDDIPDQVVCEGDPVSFTAVASGEGTLTYAWTKDGVPIGGNTATLDLGIVDESDEGVYCVAVVDGCGDDTDCATLTVNPGTITNELTDKSVCPGEDVSFRITASGTGTLTYEWTKDGVPIPGENGPTLDLEDVTLDDAGEYCVTVTGECGPPIEKCATLDVMVCAEVFCTFTQGFWGNPGGSFNGETKDEFMPDLMTTDLVLGVVGERSVTIPAGEWECIIARLPAGGTPSALPDFGDQTMTTFPDCDVPGLPLKNGKFKNVLLGQTVALSLNVRLDPELIDLELCNLMTTIEVEPGDDGLMHTDDDVPVPGTESSFFISPTILSALDDLGLDQTVGGLLELANMALAGLDTEGASISAINGAVDAINRGFDECRLLVSCDSL